MADESELVAVVVRVTLPGQPAFQLRKGELGISVFHLTQVDPPLSEEEILECFRPGSIVVYRSVAQIESFGLQLVPTLGADLLPLRLRDAHAEIRPGSSMDRTGFKMMLKNLE